MVLRSERLERGEQALTCDSPKKLIRAKYYRELVLLVVWRGNSPQIRRRYHKENLRKYIYI